MQYLMLHHGAREALRDALRAMPVFLAESFDGLSLEESALPGPDGAFSPVEQCWHLADLEREAFATRMRRLLAEADPWLPDFDGARIAEERGYRSRSLTEGIAAFRNARQENLATIMSIAPPDWLRRGVQEGVGRVRLCDIPSMMAEHDASHRREIEAWKRATGR
jgi:hypothetical protein